MNYERAYNDLIARINVAKEKPSLCMKDKHHYNGYVETGIRDALDYIVSSESEDERIRKEIIAFIEHAIHRGGGTPIPEEKEGKWISYLEHLQEYIDEIRQYAYNKGLVDAEEKQKPAWSEKDEAVLDALIRRLEGEDIYVSPHLVVECLKSLKERMPHHQQEWSEEDERIRLNIMARLEFLLLYETQSSVKTYLQKEISWLKSLRPQPHWKPSEAQMCALKYASTYVPDDEGTLAELYEQLKKFASFQQDQPESELEKAARYVYESWNGGTMDDVRRDMVELGKALNARGINYE